MSTSYTNAPVPVNAPPEKKSNAVTIVLVIVGVLLVAAVCVIGFLVALLLPAITQARAAARHVTTKHTAQQIGLAILNYEAAYQSFPAADTKDGNSQSLYSWRVNILPFMEQASTWERWNKEQSWNSPANSPLSDTHFKFFSSPLCPDSEGTNRTAFVAVVGPDTIINAKGPRKMSRVYDGISSTAMLIELRVSDIAWAEPRDVSVEEAVQLIQSCPDSRGLVVVFGDGHVSAVPPNTPEDKIIKMFNCSDGG